jgi:hypothetical protein
MVINDDELETLYQCSAWMSPGADIPFVRCEAVGTEWLTGDMVPQFLIPLCPHHMHLQRSAFGTWAQSVDDREDTLDEPPA